MMFRRLITLVPLIALAGCSALGPAAATLPPVTSTVGPSATPAPTLTATATFAPTPTPMPLVRVESGELALFNGDFTTARNEFNAAYFGASDEAVRTAALWGLSRTEFEDGNYTQALNQLRSYVDTFPNGNEIALVYFLLGETLTQLDRDEEALAAYDQYLLLRPGVLDAFVHETRGDLYTTLGDYTNALAAYQAAYEAPRLDNGARVKIKIAQTYSSSGATALALQLYDEIFAETTNDYLKAQMDLLAGRAHLQNGQTAQAYERFQHAVSNYPLSYDSYSALVALVEAGEPVSDLNRGIINYNVGQYGLALAALDRFLSSGAENSGAANYYRALTLRALGQYPEAIAAFDVFIQNFPQNNNWTTAWGDKAFTQWAYLNQHSAAAQTLQEFALVAPTSSQSTEYLREAGRIMERAGKLDEAAAIWESIAEKYPGNATAIEAIFQAGIARYRLKDYNAALTNFQRSQLLSIELADQSRAYLWVGKSYQALGDTVNAQNAWQQGQMVDPTGYYSERARGLLLGEAPFTPPATYDLNIDMEQERTIAASWVRLTFGLPPETNLDDLGPLAADLRLIRGAEFWRLGLFDQARAEFEAVREAVSENPADSFRLANYLLDLGAYRSAIFAARNVLTLAGLGTTAESLDAPKYFNYVRFGPYYSDLINTAAQTNDLHPLFLLSVMRQESLFEGFVRSSAGARGLMQIMPTTGESIAKGMQWPADFTSEDLYRPIVSINMGAYYLRSNRYQLNNDFYATLAAYNGGPANAAIWQELAGNDPDLLLEVVRFAETRDYIRRIYEIFEIYKSLYNPYAQ